MRLTPIMPMVLTSFVVGAPMASAELLNTHRIPAVLAVEAASEFRRGLRQAGVPRNCCCCRCGRRDDRGAAWRRRRYTHPR